MFSLFNSAKKVVLTVLTIGAVALGFTVEASAATLLTTGMTTAVSSGFTDLKDTVADIISVTWPFVIGIAALLATPGLVKRMISKAVGS